MTTINPQALNDQFAINGHITFKAGPGGLSVAEISNEHARAVVALHGGQVLSYQPHQQRPVLWLSDSSRYEAGQPIRGGIPVCWPWFGPHPIEADKPAHGLARISPWQVVGSEGVEGTTRLQLALANDARTWGWWPHSFRLDLLVTVGPALEVELVVYNPGDQSFIYTGALHSYFSVSDAAGITIHGLEGRAYVDKVEGALQKMQAGPVTLSGETDRIYLDTTDTCRIEDPGWGRQIVIDKAGSRTTVVWNPWQDKARRLADFGDDEYTGMVCVETANAGDDMVLVNPGGQSHRLRTVIRLEER